MKDFPMFITEYGAAALVLREIPYSAAAYITIHDSIQPELLLKECVSFCKACGAEKVFASGHEFLKSYPEFTTVLQMTCPLLSIPDTDACLWPVQPETGEEFRRIYNARMADVHNAAYMTRKVLETMLQKGDGYFIHRNGKLLGIGRASGHRIDAVAAVEPGQGGAVVSALCGLLNEETVELEVASTNEPAIRLYRRLGFIPTAAISKWYQII